MAQLHLYTIWLTACVSVLKDVIIAFQVKVGLRLHWKCNYSCVLSGLRSMSFRYFFKISSVLTKIIWLFCGHNAIVCIYQFLCSLDLHATNERVCKLRLWCLWLSFCCWWSGQASLIRRWDYTTAREQYFTEETSDGNCQQCTQRFRRSRHHFWRRT